MRDASVRIPRRTAVALALMAAFAGGRPAAAAPTVLRSADISIAMAEAGGCTVDMSLQIETSNRGPVDHRLLTANGAEVAAVSLTGGNVTLPAVETIGRTLSLPIPFAAGVHPYTLSYRVRQNGSWGDRCPLWLPMTPTDGISSAVRIRVALPPGAVPLGDTFPALAWTAGGVGTVTLGHVPAFVRTPFAPAGSARSRSLSERRIVDALALAVLAGATLIWFSTRRRT